MQVLKNPANRMRMKRTITGRIITNYFILIISIHILLLIPHYFSRKEKDNEEYRANQAYDLYGLPYPIVGTDTIFTSDFIRQLWLNNNFYGNIFSLQYHDAKTEFTFGGAYTRYEGDHYGKLIWAKNGLTGPDIWYNHDAF